MKLKYFLPIILLFAVVAASLAVVPASAQACVVRTDLPTYRVVPGDTLFLIAVRNHISPTELAADNCITNTNLIFVGQLLHLPNGSGGGTPNPNTVNVSVSFQQYEHGFMIWRSNTGDVWVYFGQSSGSVLRFLSRSYGQLPDNPIQTPTPAGKIRPIFGFGKVWGNFSNVRNGLGWATAAERSYIMHYTPVSSTRFYFSLPDGRNAVTNNNTTWSIFTGTIPGGGTPGTPAPTPQPTGTRQAVITTVTVSAAYQLFENGFLIWRSDTGRIEQFDKNSVAGYNLNQYATLPDNPVTDLPPAGRVSPINGFGRVWGNFPSTRNALGWGLGTEQGYQATFKSNSVTFIICVNIPDGRFVSYPHFDGARSYHWQYETTCS